MPGAGGGRSQCGAAGFNPKPKACIFGVFKQPVLGLAGAKAGNAEDLDGDGLVAVAESSVARESACGGNLYLFGWRSGFGRAARWSVSGARRPSRRLHASGRYAGERWRGGAAVVKTQSECDDGDDGDGRLMDGGSNEWARRGYRAAMSGVGSTNKRQQKVKGEPRDERQGATGQSMTISGMGMGFWR
jgi:hypothetical protein